MTKDRQDWVNEEVLGYMVDVYINELFWLLTSIKSKCEQLFEITKPPETGFIIKIDMESHSLIKSIVDDSTEVANLIRPHEKLKDEPNEKYLFRKHRGEYLSNLFNGVAITELLKHDLRNSLAHFDEKLDSLTHEISKKATKGPQRLAYNMVVSDRNVFHPFPFPIRVYVSSERKIYNMRWELDIGKIYNESVAMIEVLKKVESIKNAEKPGGLFLSIPQLRDL
ncbi:MAG: hypothetical protein JRN10_08430 [Nitrososphaerota archaeon]|jgi:hypothetical protein|nr:hypothetical protein [Nitrososphaerota archaeon]MDG6931244.1 hypothetical protein [Nitrososphaerota archaeon]